MEMRESTRANELPEDPEGLGGRHGEWDGTGPMRVV